MSGPNPPTRRVTGAPTRLARNRLRAEWTAELLDEANRTTDAGERRELVGAVVELNHGVATAIADRYRGHGIDRDDLAQTAALGLVKAARGFDPGHGRDFLSFAVPTVEGEVKRYFRDSRWTVRPPRRIQELRPRLFATRDELAQRLGHQPSIPEVAAALGESEADVAATLLGEGGLDAASIDTPARDDGTPLHEVLAADDSDAVRTEARLTLAPAVRDLPERDRRVLFLRFFEGRSQREIGEQIGVTQMQVSRILTRILSELRGRLEDPGHGRAGRPRRHAPHRRPSTRAATRRGLGQASPA